MRLNRCNCIDPDPLPIHDGSLTSICSACSGWYTIAVSEVGIDRLLAEYSHEPAKPGPPSEPE